MAKRKENNNKSENNAIRKKIVLEEDPNNQKKVKIDKKEPIKEEKKVSDVAKKKIGKRKLCSYILLSLTFIITVILGILSIVHSSEDIHQLSIVVQSVLLMFFSFFFVLMGIYMDSKKGQNIVIVTAFLFSCFSGFQLLEQSGVIKLPIQDAVQNFTNRSLTEVMAWSSEHNVTVEQTYENSDSVEPYYIIRQDVQAGTLLKDVQVLTVTVSNGPDTTKQVIFPNMIGKDVDEVISFVESNYFTNVIIDFVKSDTPRDIVMEQDKSGQLARDEEIHITVSLGNEDLVPVSMENLVDRSFFIASTWLKRNGIAYEVVYEYSETIQKGYVMKQSIEAGNMVDPNQDTITLTISKGSKITAPNLLDMSAEEITAWVIEHNLKITFQDRYDDTIPLGKPIEVSCKEGDTLEEGMTITVTLSKGPLKMEDFKTVSDYRAWAEKYEIPFKEEAEFSDSIPVGGIIRMSHQVGETIKNGDTITITVSEGKQLEVPNLVGKTKSDAQKACSTAGVKCSFIYGGYTESTNKDVVIKQSRSSGSKITESSTVTVTLSSGIIEKVDVPNFKGQTKASVESQCNSLGITCTFNTESNFSTTPAGTVTGQSASGRMNKGSKITVTLSRGEAISYTVNIQATWFGTTYQETVNTLKSKLESACPGVTFIFKAKDVNEGAGMISSDSQIKAGNNTFKEGQTYTITVNR